MCEISQYCRSGAGLIRLNFAKFNFEAKFLTFAISYPACVCAMRDDTDRFRFGMLGGFVTLCGCAYCYAAGCPVAVMVESGVDVALFGCLPVFYVVGLDAGADRERRGAVETEP